MAKRNVIKDNTCHCCQRTSKSVIHAIWECVIHAIWECAAAQDVWAGSSIALQKCTTNFNDFMQLFEVLMDRLVAAEMKLFLVQAWTRNNIVHRGQMKDPSWLNKRAGEYLEEYKKAQEHLAITDTTPSRQHWKPSPQNVFKLNFAAAVLLD